MSGWQKDLAPWLKLTDEKVALLSDPESEGSVKWGISDVLLGCWWNGSLME